MCKATLQQTQSLLFLYAAVLPRVAGPHKVTVEQKPKVEALRRFPPQASVAEGESLRLLCWPWL